MKGKVVHHLKKKIPYRKMASILGAVENTSNWTARHSPYLKSWCALKAGLWQDKYFFNFHQMLAADVELRSLILAMDYKRLKYGWSLEELEELSRSRNFQKYSRNSLLSALIASLYHELGDFDNTLESLNKFLSDDPTPINGYLGLISFALEHGFTLSGLPPNRSAKLQQLYSKFQDFRTFFGKVLHDKKIVVVGNGNFGEGCAAGNLIDAYDQVFRFNNFPSEGRYERDYGKKTTVWVRTPSIHEVPLRHDIQPATIVFSTPLMLYSKNGNWQWMLEYCDREENLVLFDVTVFRDLVQTLEAPPSAGVLAAHNINELTEDLSHVRFLGFDFNTGKKSHYFDNQKPASRHNWAAEKSFFTKNIAQSIDL